MGHKIGTKCYNNGVIKRYFIPGSEPEGWVLGGLPLTDEHKKKVSQGLNSRSAEEKADANYRRGQSWLNTYNNKSDKEKQLIIQTRVNTMTNKSIEEKAAYSDKLSKALLGKNKGKVPYNKDETKYSNQSVMNTSIKVSKYMKDFCAKQSDEYFKIWREKMREKMHENGHDSPLKMSTNETRVYKNLCEKYGEEHVHYHNDGKIDPRYPYEVDFYVDTDDLFVEVQGHPAHGDHPFDNASAEDLELLHKLENENSRWSNMIIKVWTKSDPEKRNCAHNNNLNYIEIYN